MVAHAAAVSTTAGNRRVLHPSAVCTPVYPLRSVHSVVAQKNAPARVTCANAAEAVAAPSTAAPASDLRKYETLIVLKPTLTDEERDKELARFESFLIAVCVHPWCQTFCGVSIGWRGKYSFFMQPVFI